MFKVDCVLRITATVRKEKEEDEEVMGTKGTVNYEIIFSSTTSNSFYRPMSGLIHGSIDMDAMERKFFTSNINKQDIDDTRHNDVDPGQAGDIERGNDYNPEVEAIASATPHTDKSMLNQNRTGSANTGPKGVKADYDEYKQHQEQERARINQEKEAVLDRLVNGAISSTPSVSYSAMEAQRLLEKAIQRHTNHHGNTTNNSNDQCGSNGNDEDTDDDLLNELEDDEDTFMAAYREKRRQEMQMQSKLPSYGKVTNVDAFGFVDRLERTNANIYVIVHMWEKDIRACNTLDVTLESLAREHQHIDFLRLCRSDTPTGLPCNALPALLIYQDGELIETIMKVDEKVGDKCAKNDVEKLLSEKISLR